MSQDANSDSDAWAASPLARNVVRLYAFRFLRDFILIMPAMVPVYRAAGLHATRMLLVQASFSVATVLGLVAMGPIGLAMSGSWWPVLVTPLGAFAWGALTPWLLERQNREFASEHRATALSVSALQGRILFVVVSPLFGWLCDRRSDRIGFLFLLLMWIALLAMAGLLALRNNLGEAPE